jgi:long-chain acyl-CoA synthetase
MTDYPWANLASMFFENAERLQEKPFLWAKHDGVYQPLTWTETARQVCAIGESLKAQGIKPGDRVALISENRPEWIVADTAIMAIGAITVPAYVTNTETDHLHILTNSGACGAIVSTKRLAKHFLPAAIKATDTKFVISIDNLDSENAQGLDILSWGECLNTDVSTGVREQAEQWSENDTACIIYTSGTGGLPKGVMLSHLNLFHNVIAARDALNDLDLGDEVFLCFLPLSHSYEHMAGQLFPTSIGAEIYFAEGIESLGANMVEAKPTIMTAVPRLYETMHQRISLGVRKAGGLKEKMFAATLRLGQKKYETGGQLSIIERIQDALLDKLVRQKVRGRFGGHLKALVSGGAPLNPDIGLFFTALGLRLLQGYGQTETTPVISVNRPSLTKMHTVGPPLLNTNVKIANDGEILVNGDLVMKGYWENEEASHDVIKDGWVHTGDIGEIDGDGHLIITDRKKDIIVNSGGDNVAPQRVEGLLSLELEIFQALVYGNKRPHLVAIIVPDEAWAKQQDGDLHKALKPVIDKVNERLSTIEKVRRFIVADEPFTIENGQFTPTMKVRRHVINEVYGDRLSGLYR